MAIIKSYKLWGGNGVRIKPLEVTQPGTIKAEEGCAFNPVTCNVSGALEDATRPVVSNGTVELTPSTGKIGFSKVTVMAEIPPYTQNVTVTPRAQDGNYTYIATYNDNTSAVGVCQIRAGAINHAYGDGTFAIDTSGDYPILTWTPTVTPYDSGTVWFAATTVN